MEMQVSVNGSRNVSRDKMVLDDRAGWLEAFMKWCEQQPKDWLWNARSWGHTSNGELFTNDRG